jgi:glycosyltransferase involved in cell wall biosynthesis
VKFSITIPTYKSHYLKEAIGSVVGQTYADWELIIVDDCSPEDLRFIVEPFLSDSRIRYYRNEKNCGAVNVVDNWNICLGYCTGDYVICMGDDDRLLPCCLAEYQQLIQKHPGLNVYHTRTEIIDEEGVVTDLQEPRPEWESVLSLIWNRWDHRNKQYIGDFCYDTAYLKNAGGYYKLPLAWGSDDITATLAAKENGIANTQTFGFQYRDNASTITRSTQNIQVKIQARITLCHLTESLLNEKRHTQLSPSDHLYIQTIGTIKERHHFITFSEECPLYIKGNPLKLRWCYRQLKNFHYPKSTFLKWYLKSLYYLFTFK